MSNNLKLAKEIIKDIENISKEDLDKAIKEVDKEFEEEQYIVKTADEMFKELGYEIKEEKEGQIRYINNINKNNTVIAFDLDYNTVAVFQYYDGFEYMSMQELQAINKKVEELGWIK